MRFDEIMNYLSEITKTELFMNIKYDSYLKDKKSGVPEMQLLKKYKENMPDFRFLDEFRVRVNGYKITGELIKSLETKYNVINKRLVNKL